MKIKELRALSREELLLKERNLREELFKLKQQRYSGRVEKPHMFASVRKDIAKIKTILNEEKRK